MRRLLILAVAILLSSLALQAARAEEAETADVEQEFARHELGLFLGATTSSGETGFTVGGDYEFRPWDYLGFGFIAEFVPSLEDRDWVILVPIFSHPNRDAEGGWELIIGPGVEIREGGSDFLVRLGMSYGFPVDGWTISPKVDADLVFGEWSWVYGIKIGRGF